MKISTHIAMLLTLVAMQNAAAIQLAGEPNKTAATPFQSVSAEREGTIEKIDPNGKTMVVDGMSYSFSSSTTAVHGSSLQALKKNSRIRFKALNEYGKERITEIWLISPLPH